MRESKDSFTMKNMPWRTSTEPGLDRKKENGAWQRLQRPHLRGCNVFRTIGH
jgi:hypothetical protein